MLQFDLSCVPTRHHIIIILALLPDAVATQLQALAPSVVVFGPTVLYPKPKPYLASECRLDLARQQAAKPSWASRSVHCCVGWIS